MQFLFLWEIIIAILLFIPNINNNCVYCFALSTAKETATITTTTTTTNHNSITSNDSVVAAYDGSDDNDLESFLVESQRTLLNDNNTTNIIRLNTRVEFCATLQDFLASRTEVLVDDDDGTIQIKLCAFVEPADWQHYSHTSRSNTTLNFVRDDYEESTEEDDDAITKTTTSNAALLERRLKNSPTVALKIIRREAIEELHYDYINKKKNRTTSKEEEEDDNSKNDVDKIGPRSGDADAACRINRLAIEWSIRTTEAQEIITDTSTDTTTDTVVAVSCQKDRILSMKDATTQFLQSRVSYRVKEEGGILQRLCIRSPSLVTPISGVRSKGTGCTFCKVVIPKSIANALSEGTLLLFSEEEEEDEDSSD